MNLLKLLKKRRKTRRAKCPLCNGGGRYWFKPTGMFLVKQDQIYKMNRLIEEKEKEIRQLSADIFLREREIRELRQVISIRPTADKALDELTKRIDFEEQIIKNNLKKRT